MRSFGQRLCQLQRKAIFLERRVGAANEPIMIRRHDETWVVNLVVNPAPKSIVSSRNGYRMRPAKSLERFVGWSRRCKANYIGLAHRELRHRSLRESRR